MTKSEPLLDKDGEVRELLIEDLKKFRPITEVATPSLVKKLGIQTKRSEAAEEAALLSRKPAHRA